MNYEYNFDEMTKEQLQQKYNWNLKQIQYTKRELLNKKRLFYPSLIIDGFAGLFCILVTILLNKINFFTAVIALLLCAVHIYCNSYANMGMDNTIAELKNRILELEKENEIIKN